MYTDKRVEQSQPISATSAVANMPPSLNISRHQSSHAHLLAHPHQHAASAGDHDQGHSAMHSLHAHQLHLQMQHFAHPHHPTNMQRNSPQNMVQHQQEHEQPQLHQIQQQNQQISSAQIQHPQHQQQAGMFSRFDANKSTKGASKLRRDLINAEIANLRDLLPLPQSTRQRLSQLQLMALVCVYVRKANYFQQVFKRNDISMLQTSTPNIGFSKALSGFLMMLTQNGKLLYISDNAAEYLGHSMEDLLIHGDSVYDIIDKQDHAAIQAELNRNIIPSNVKHTGGCLGGSADGTSPNLNNLEGSHRMFLCRMNVSRNARRQMRFGDQKVVLVQGHYLSYLPLCSRNEPVFLATCTPIAMPETRECVVQGATNVFTTIHAMDMKIAHIDKNGEFHLGYSKASIQGLSWYNFIHSDNLREAQSKHRLITQSEQDRSCILLVRMQRREANFIWVHIVLQVRDSQDTNQQPMIVCTNQVLDEREASVMITNSWLYHYYSVQSKIQFSLPYDGAARVPPTAPVTVAAAAYYHHHHHAPYTHGSHVAIAPAAAAAETMSRSSKSNDAVNTIDDDAAYPTVHAHHEQHPSPLYYHHSHHHTQHNPHQLHHEYASATPYPPYHVTGSPVGTPSPNTSAHHQTQHNKLNTHDSYTHRGVAGEREKTRNHLHPHIYQLDPRRSSEPVDFSQISQQQQQCTSLNTSSIDRCNSSTSAHIHSNPSTSAGATSHPNDTLKLAGDSQSLNGNATSLYNRRSPPPKKRHISKLEPLFMSDESNETRKDMVHAGSSADTHSTSVVFATVVPTRPRFLSKAFSIEPPDFIDQWNPSPPWSENAQKISLDGSTSSQQELSPCITTTPPTPTSATSSAPANNDGHVVGPAFSFEWVSDQLVPVVDPCLSYINPERIPVMLAHGANSWTPPTEHHHHLSQHIASHARYITLQSGAIINPNLDIQSMSEVHKKKEKFEDSASDDKGS